MIKPETSVTDLGLSARSTNALMRAHIFTLGELLAFDTESLYAIPNLGVKSVTEIQNLQQYYSQSDNDPNTTVSHVEVVPSQTQSLDLQNNRDITLLYAQANDQLLADLKLSLNARGSLHWAGYDYLSEILFLTEENLMSLPKIRPNSVNDILSYIEKWYKENSLRLQAFSEGDLSAILSPETLRTVILEQYKELGFDGLSLDEMSLRTGIPAKHLKAAIGSLLAEGLLEYVDFRCYRVYPKIAESIHICPMIRDRDRTILNKRLDGETFESIGLDFGLSRERVRQVVLSGLRKIRNWNSEINGVTFFDEEYYRHFYESYAFEKKDAEEWLGITPDVFQLYTLLDIQQGSNDLTTALDDTQLDTCLRLKIKNYLNRDRLFIDGVWVDKRRAELERIVVRKYCRDSVSFTQFCKLYNDFLAQEGITDDDDLLYTDAVIASRKNRLAEDRHYILWKQSEQLRFYDIDGGDFTELLDTLALDSYRNTELSTQKLIQDYPDLMEKYDLRDCYELHNLLRKIVPEGSYHDLHFSKMPMLRFGVFDRDAAIMELIRDNNPITKAELCRLLHEKYGYDIAVIQGAYLTPFSDYCRNGTYSIDYAPIPAGPTVNSVSAS